MRIIELPNQPVEAMLHGGRSEASRLTVGVRSQ